MEDGREEEEHPGQVEGGAGVPWARLHCEGTLQVVKPCCCLKETCVVDDSAPEGQPQHGHAPGQGDQPEGGGDPGHPLQVHQDGGGQGPEGGLRAPEHQGQGGRRGEGGGGGEEEGRQTTWGARIRGEAWCCRMEPSH